MGARLTLTRSKAYEHCSNRLEGILLKKCSLMWQNDRAICLESIEPFRSDPGTSCPWTQQFRCCPFFILYQFDSKHLNVWTHVPLYPCFPGETETHSMNVSTFSTDSDFNRLLWICFKFSQTLDGNAQMRCAALCNNLVSSSLYRLLSCTCVQDD